MTCESERPCLFYSLGTGKKNQRFEHGVREGASIFNLNVAITDYLRSGFRSFPCEGFIYYDKACGISTQ
jgi:hypothetical protein